jgi:hypothetical protein
MGPKSPVGFAGEERPACHMAKISDRLDPNLAPRFTYALMGPSWVLGHGKRGGLVRHKTSPALAQATVLSSLSCPAETRADLAHRSLQTVVPCGGAGGSVVPQTS